MRTLLFFLSVLSFFAVIVLFIAFSESLNLSANFLIFYIYFTLFSFLVSGVYYNKQPHMYGYGMYMAKGTVIKFKAVLVLIFPTAFVIYFLANTSFDIVSFILGTLIGSLIGFLGYKASLKDFALKK